MDSAERWEGETAERLRSAVAAAEAGAAPPPGLARRVMAPPERRPAGAAGRWSTPVVAAAAVVGLLVGSVGVFAWGRAGAPEPVMSGGRAPVTVTVFNAEEGCRALRTIECGLGISADPRRYRPEDVLARVWHGDRVTAECVVVDGVRLSDESGVSSSRWYRITTPNGVTGYLPGVRTRNTREVGLC
jgi:hypothetical protein